MKILHTAMMKNFSSGIAEQMLAESNAAGEINCEFKVFIFSPVQKIDDKYSLLFKFCELKSKNKILSWFEFRSEYYSFLKSKEDEIDCYILRYSAYDPLQYYFIKNSKKPIYLVHHTKEHDELKLLGNKGYLYYLIDKIWGNASINKVDGIIAVTNELIDYERKRVSDTTKRAILYPNGITVSKDDIKDNRLDEKPEILFVASFFYSWHGLDLVLEEVKKSNRNFILHLVGELLPEDLLKAREDNRIVLHGKLKSEEIDELSSKCWVGLGSFALDRKNTEEGSTLKVREYLNNGLPIYSGHKDIFPNDFKFYKFGKPNIDAILDFSIKIRDFSKTDIRNFSAKYISKKIRLQELIKAISFYKKEL